MVVTERRGVDLDGGAWPLPFRITVPVFVRSLRRCADFCYSVFSVWCYMSDLSILKMYELSAICAAIGE